MAVKSDSPPRPGGAPDQNDEYSHLMQKLNQKIDMANMKALKSLLVREDHRKKQREKKRQASPSGRLPSLGRNNIAQPGVRNVRATSLGPESPTKASRDGIFRTKDVQMLDLEGIWRREKRLEQVINTHGKRGQRLHLQSLAKHYNRCLLLKPMKKMNEKREATHNVIDLQQDSI